MQESFAELLRCPVDRSRLTVDEVSERSVDGGIVTGRLISGGGRRYPIVRAVPWVHGDFGSVDEASTVQAFGEEWARYDDFTGFMGSEDLFAEFSGLSRGDVAGRRVLEVGCGGGRWLRVLANWGAKEVVGLDFSSAVDQARRLTASFPQVHVVRGSALATPLGPVFDLVVSIGVLHHLRDPVLGLENIRRTVTDSHLVVFWVYAREGNEVYLRLVRPLRRVGPHLPKSALVGLSRVLATAVWGHLRLIDPVAQAVGIRLPLASYGRLLRRLRFRDLESVVYDQLTPSIAIYPTKDQVLAWVEGAGATPEKLFHRTNNSWQCHLRFRNQTAHE